MENSINSITAPTALTDSREKDERVINSVNTSFDGNCLIRKLDYGDYSAIFNGQDLSTKFVIERKRKIDELAINLSSKYRNRFFNEFYRAKSNGVKVILLIQNASLEDIKNHNYSSKMSPNAILGSLKALETSFGVEVVFTYDEDIGAVIKDIIMKEISLCNKN